MILAKEQPDQTEGHRTLIKLNEGIQKQVINKFRYIHALRLNKEIELEIEIILTTVEFVYNKQACNEIRLIAK
jgi:hypothetical protein